MASPVKCGCSCGIIKLLYVLYNCPSTTGVADNAQPRRDSALQDDLVIHECQHGTTNRMTGGGTARCFQSLEAGAVAEGIADVMSE